LAPFPNVGGGVLPPEQPSASPIRNALEQRNLLKPRSLIAKRVAARAGRLDYLPDENGDWRGAVSPRAERDFRPAPVPPPSVAPTLNDRMADDIKQQAEEYFELGLANYRAGRLNEAADCIALVKEIERDSPRGFIADVFIAQSSQCYFRAIMSLHRAIQNAKSLDDLKIDRFIERMYPGDEVDDQRRAFRREVEVLNLLVNQNPEISQPFILLAYYAWLNGDFGTAVSAAEKAERGSAPDFAQVAARFRKLLQEADRGPPTSSPGG
jgi:tetratricopeptide (TPR) repeat protein